MPYSGADNLQQVLRQQESLRQVIESIGSELELRPLLTRIVRNACELLGAVDGTIGLYDRSRGVIRTEAAYCMPEDELGSEQAPGQGLAGQVLLTKAPVLLARYGDVPHPVRPELCENTVIGVPIYWHGDLIGVFGLGSPPPRCFSEQEAEVLALFATHTAVAIANAQRLGEERLRTQRLKVIAEISQIITRDLRLDEMLQRAADAIHERLGYPNIAIPLLDPQDPGMLVIRILGGHYHGILKGEYRLSVETGIIGAAVRERRVQMVNDVAADPRHIPTPGAQGIRAELAVPIALEGRVLGVLNVESAEPFVEDDADSLQIIADHLAIAIQNSRLYQSGRDLAVLQERQRLARELHDSVTQHLFSIHLLTQSLEPAWRRDPAEAERRVERLVELTRAASAEMRALLAELRPGESDPIGAREEYGGIARVRLEGLEGALRRHLGDLSRDGVMTGLESQDYQRVPMPVEEELYRIAQEALHNVVKHARARQVEVKLSSGGGRTMLEVRDDGVGFETDRARPGGGMGLSSMRERAEALGGSFQIHSSPGNGTRVEVVVSWEPGTKGRHEEEDPGSHR